MSSRAVHDITQPWTTPAGITAIPVPGPAPGVSAMEFRSVGAPSGATATLTLAASVDLSGYDELRFWGRADRAGSGRPGDPFVAELGYADAGDGATDDHHWFVPTRAGRWEQHRVGIGADRRSAVTSLRLRLPEAQPLRFELAELLAVAEEPLLDVEDALLHGLETGVRPPGPTADTVVTTAAGATTLVVTMSRGFRAGNRVRVTNAGVDPDASGTGHDVREVAHDPEQDRTTLTLSADTAIVDALPAGSTVTVQAPVVVEEPALSGGLPAPAPDPALLLSLTDQREDLARAWSVPQRDSFRRRGAATVCSVRPPPRPLLLEYQVLVTATDRSQALRLRADALGSLGTQTPLRVNGVEVPVASVPAPVRSARERVVVAPITVQVGARLEAGPRVETAWARTGRITAAPLDAPDDAEAIGLAT